MKNHSVTFGAAKITASLLHLAAVAVMFIGISLMYINDNMGVGLNQISHLPYENTEEFSERFNQDLNDIFHYIEYNEIFATDGSIDVSKEMLKMTIIPDEIEVLSLEDLINYLQKAGYTLTEDFACTRSPDAEVTVKEQTGYVNWTAADPNRKVLPVSKDLKRATVEECALEIMSTLNRYYTTYNRLMVRESNLHFKVVFSDAAQTNPMEISYTNDPALTPESAAAYGKYAYLKGNSVFYDTNLKSIPLNTISALAARNPYPGSAYYLLAAVDTEYPVRDAYYKAHQSYVKMQQSYIAGFLLMAAGALAAVLTLLFLLRVSGRRSMSDRTVTLHGFDRNSTETGLLLFSCFIFLCLVICRYTLIRMIHLVMPEDSWSTGEKALYTAVLYLGLLLLFFSLLRRYKAGILWKNSLICKCGRRCSIFFDRQAFSGQLIAAFFSYLAFNTVLLSLIWFLFRKIYINPLLIKVLIAVLACAFAALNLWAFYLMFRRQAQLDKIHNAVDRLASGETSYKVDLDEFDGREKKLAEGVNNISTGLETALQEKVKSERLKADLITNVSHDIKTPLTSIINYVDLIKRENIRDEKILGYLEVLEQKSQRLKTLTEDLVEASKASSGNVQLETGDIDLIELVYQTNGEFEEKFASRHLELIISAPDETYIIEADGRRLWRVLENLYNNAFKYAMDGSRIYVDITREEPGTRETPGLWATPGAWETSAPPETKETGGGLDTETNGNSDTETGGNPDTETGGSLGKNTAGAPACGDVFFTIKNISANPLNIKAEDLTERFVRGDVARTTEGSGLGLSIAKDLTELQGGRFEIYIDGDLFKVRLAFHIKEIKRGGASHAV